MIGTVPDPAGSSPSGHRAAREIALFGAAGGALLAVLKLTEYRFLVLHHSAEIYTALAAALFAAVGIWLGVTLRRPGPEVIVKEVQVDGPFLRDDERVRALGLTPRETEILELIAAGLSNREIADRLCVSENTVKTHSSRVFDKLGARRRTEAVRIARADRLIP